MKTLPNWQTFLRTLAARLSGSRVDMTGEPATYLSTKAQPTETKLLKPRITPKPKGDVARVTPESAFLRELAQRNLIIEDQPDYGERRPVDYDGLPNG